MLELRERPPSIDGRNMDEPLSVYFVKIIIDDIGILAHLNGFDVRFRIVSDFIDFTSFA